MALEIDDEIIDWALKTVRKNRVDFSDWTDEDIYRCSLELFGLRLAVNTNNGKCCMVNEPMAAHAVFLVGAVSSVENDQYEKFIGKCWFEKAKQIRKRERGAAVLYGLLLYALRRTGYKCYLTEECLLTDDEKKEIKNEEKAFREQILREGAYSYYLNPSLWADVKRLMVKKSWYLKYIFAMCESLCPLLMPLARGGDFPTYENGDLIDYTDKPLEFAIEAVKASVQES